MNRPRHEHPARRRQLLHPLRQHHPRTRHRAPGNHLLTQRNPHPHLGHHTVAQTGVVLGVRALESQRRAHRVRGTRKLRHQRIAPDLVHRAAVALHPLRQTRKRLLHARVRQRLVAAHQRRRARHVGVHNNSQLARLCLYQRKTLGNTSSEAIISREPMQSDCGSAIQRNRRGEQVQTSRGNRVLLRAARCPFALISPAGIVLVSVWVA